MDKIYLDHASTTSVHPQVAQTMVDQMQEHFGNPSNIHSFGRDAKAELNKARKLIGKHLSASPDSFIFTSGGTESDNLAVLGCALSAQEKGRHIITTEIEHLAVLNSCRQLEQMDYEITYLPVNEKGRVNISDVKEAVRHDTVLISIMYGNNEVGTVQPVKEVGRFAEQNDIVFHTDAVQALGTVDINIRELPANLISFSSHKVGGPKGVGCLYAEADLQPLLFGGQQQRQLRPGTENVPGTAGFALAVKMVCESMTKRRRNYEKFRQLMLDVLDEQGVSHAVNGHLQHYLPHILNISFPDIKADVLVKNLDLQGIAVSTGSACTAGTVQPSHVVTAMHGAKRASSAVRFSFGRSNTARQVEKAALTTAGIIRRLREGK